MKKRILNITSGLFYTGGVENYVETLSQGLKEKSWDVSVCSISAFPESEKVEKLKKEGIKVFLLDQSRFEDSLNSISGKIYKNIFLYYVKKITSLKSVIGKLKPDLVFAHGEEAEFLLSFIDFHPKVNVIHSEALFPKNFIYHTFTKRNRKKYDGTVFVSDKLKKNFIEFSSTKKVVIPTGIDLEAFRKVYDENIRKNSIRRIGFLGRMSKEKGIYNLAEALVKIARQKKDIEFVFSGDGSELENLKKKIPTDIRKRFKFTGVVKDVREFFSGTDLFILPSFTEGFPLTVLEAMASGTIAVVSDVGGVSEIIENEQSGFLLTDNQPETIYNSISEILENKYDLTVMKKNAFKKVQSYSLTKFFESYDKFIREMLYE